VTYHGSDIRRPVVIEQVPKARLGLLLNTVERPTVPCPACSTSGPLAVYLPAVRWPCGHTRSLPPIQTSYRPVSPVARIREVA
jgi:hypothetical protein